MVKLDLFLKKLTTKFYKTRDNVVFKWIMWVLFDWNIGLGLAFRKQKTSATWRLLLFLVFLACVLLYDILGGLSIDSSQNYQAVGGAGYVFLTLSLIALGFNILCWIIDGFNIYANKNWHWYSFLKRANSNKKSAEQKISDPDLAQKIIVALGGFTNLSNVDACITKLRVEVKDASRVMTDRLRWQKEYSALGFIIRGKGIQIAYGARAEVLRSIISNLQTKQSQVYENKVTKETSNE